MQRKFGMLLVLVLALSMVFCFGAIAWAEEDTGAETQPEEQTPADETPADETPAEETPAEETPADEAPAEAPAEASVFTDVPADHWAAEYIADILAKGVTQGTSATTFSPEATLTRAQFVTFLGRLAGVDAEEHAAHESKFTDIGDVAWAYGYICWAAEIGVTTGATETTFNPQGALNREQMATMVKRFADYYGIKLGADTAPASLADASAISTWAVSSVYAMVPAYMNLDADKNFKPQASATRAEMAQVISLFPTPEAGFVPAAPAADEPAADEPADGETADGETADGETADGETADGETADGETADGETADGEGAE